MASPLRESSAKTWIAAIIGGLLCSNCCALQLVLNYLGLGCAGFAILSPFRFYIVFAISGVLFVFRPLRSSSRVPSRFCQAALFFFLICLPEIISLYSRHGIYSFTSDYSPSSPLLVRVSGMKCAACGERARTVSLSVPCVQDSAVYWEKGYMKLQAISGTDLAHCGRSVSSVLHRAGFEIISVDLCAHEKPPSLLFPWSLTVPRLAYLNSTGNCFLLT